MKSIKQLYYLLIDLDRWAYALRIPVLFIPIVLLLYVQTWSVLAYRTSRFVHLLNFKPLKYLLFLPSFIFKKFAEIISSNTISEKADIGPGFYIAHTGAIVIGGGSKAGINFSVRQCVTLGGGAEVHGHPVIGNNVVVGAGAVIIGVVSIGSNVLIGANAVVNKDLPDNARAVGVPAKVINEKGSYGISVRNYWSVYRD
jgi:serine O-acetyltransferase